MASRSQARGTRASGQTQYRIHPYLRPSDTFSLPQGGQLPDHNDNNADPSAPGPPDDAPTFPLMDYPHHYQPTNYAHEVNATPPTADHQLYAHDTHDINPYGFHAHYNDNAAPSIDHTHGTNASAPPTTFGPVFGHSIESMIYEDQQPRTLWHNTPQRVDFNPGPSTFINDYISNRLVHPDHSEVPLARDIQVQSVQDPYMAHRLRPVLFGEWTRDTVPVQSISESGLDPYMSLPESHSEPFGELTRDMPMRSIPGLDLVAPAMTRSESAPRRYSDSVMVNPGPEPATTSPLATLSGPTAPSGPTAAPSGPTATPSGPTDPSGPTGPTGPTNNPSDPPADSARLKQECSELAYQYFCGERPLRDQNADKTWLGDEVVANMAVRHGGSDIAAWTKTNRDMLQKTAKHTLYDLSNIFKRIASIIVHCYYGLFVPLEHRVDLAAEWTPIVTHVLQDWRFTDGQQSLGSDQSARPGVPFGHPALVTTLLIALWYQPTKKRPLFQYLPDGDVGLDKMLAYCSAVLHWALTNLKQGRMVNFEADIFGETYNDALARMQKLRAEGGNEGALFLQLIDHLRARGAELAATLS